MSWNVNDTAEASSVISSIVKDYRWRINNQVYSRAYRASNELRTAAVDEVLRGQRHGRIYNVPGTGRMTYYKKSHTAKITYRKYTASAPGEPPAVRTGIFRLSWKPRVKGQTVGGDAEVHSMITSDARTDGKKRYLLGDILEHGTKRMAPRPYMQKTKETALPRVMKIYREPYLR